MRSRFVSGLFLLTFVTGCPADPEPGDPESSTSSTSTPSGESECGTGGCCTFNPGPCPAESSTGSLPPSSSSSDGDLTTTAATTDTTVATDTTDGAPSCELGPLLAMFAEGKTEPVDCGTVTLDDDAAAWIAASECAVTTAAAQEAFFAAFQLQGIDSIVYDGYYGSVGFTYALGRLFSDTLADPMVVAYSCTDLVATVGCEPDVGQHCLECVGTSEPVGVECAPS